MKRLVSLILILVCFQSLALQNLSAQDDFGYIFEQIKNRNTTMVESEEFSLTFTLTSEVLNSESINRGIINNTVSINKIGKDWAVVRTFEPQPELKRPEEIPKDPYYIVLKDGKLFWWRSEQSVAVVSHIGENLSAGKEMRFLRYAGFNPGRQVLEDGGGNWNKSAKEVSRKVHQVPIIPWSLEEFGGEIIANEQPSEIVTIKTKREEIELDPSLGFAVKNRLVMYGGRMFRKIECRNFKEIKDGLWLPQQVDVHLYASHSDDPKKLWGKVTQISHYKIKHFDWEADRSAFDIQVRENVFVSDGTRNVTYMTTNSGDPFRDDFENSKIIKQWSGLSFWKIILVGVSALCLGSIIAVYFSRIRR